MELMVPVYVGLDYHEDTIRACVLTEEGEVLANRNLPNEVGAVRELVHKLNGVVRGVAIEACCGSADFATQLESITDWTVKLAHPAGVHQLKKGPDKTDHGDAWLLADLLRVNYLPQVWLADGKTRQLRRLIRYRQGLAATRKDIKLRILSLLREERFPNTSDSNRWTKKWFEWLKTLPVGEHTRWVLDREVERLERIDEDLAAAEQRMTDATQDDALVQQLLAIPGIALVTAFTLRAVIGRFDRFKNGKQLSRYCGVTPCNASTGKKQADAGLIDSGHDILRPVLIQLAKRLPRLDPRWKALHTQLIRRKSANVASAALANRWLRRLYYDVVRPTDKAPPKDQAT